MGDYKSEGFAKAEMEERNKVKGNADAAKVFCRRMAEDIVHGVAAPQKGMEDFVQAVLRLGGFDRFCRSHLQYRAIGAWDDFFVGPFSQPGCPEPVGKRIGRQGDPWENTLDIDLIGKVKMAKHLDDAPFSRCGIEAQVLLT